MAPHCNVIKGIITVVQKLYFNTGNKHKVHVLLTYRSELSKKLIPHPYDNLHGGLGQKVLLTEYSFPAITASFLPCLTIRNNSMNAIKTCQD